MPNIRKYSPSESRDVIESLLSYYDDWRRMCPNAPDLGFEMEVQKWREGWSDVPYSEDEIDWCEFREYLECYGE